MNAEDTLLPSARRMDNDALTKIFDLYASAIYKYAFRLCRDSSQADQVVGDVFSKLLDELSAGKGPVTNLRSYLYEVAYHLIVDAARYSSRRAPLELLEMVDLCLYEGYSTNPEIENRMEVKKVLDAVQSLSSDQRHIIVLRILEGFSIKETAAILGKTTGSVKVAQCRALEILRNALVIGMISPDISNSSHIEMTLGAY